VSQAIPNIQVTVGPFLDQARALGARGVPDQRLAAALLYRQLVSPDQLGQMLADAAANGHSFAEAVSALDIKRNERLEVEAIANGLPFVDITNANISSNIINLIRPEQARSNQAVPIALDLNNESGLQRVTIALARPANAPGRRQLEQFFQAKDMTVAFVAASPDQIERLIDSRYKVFEEVEDVDDPSEDAIEDLSGIQDSDGPIPRMFARIITDAVNAKASDLHLVIGENGRGLDVKMRVDGVLHLLESVPERNRQQLMAVFKLNMQGMDLGDSRSLQNGRFTKKVNGREIDFRGATLYTVQGEEMRIRLLDREGLDLDLRKMGFSDYNLGMFRPIFHSSYGAILICGPTGSGKSSTLYAVLKELITPERSILTIEDPVEYKLPGISQNPVSDDQNRTFLNLLRQALRSDPDVIMVGEIRDTDTAETAMRGAISGHLLLSTLHALEAAAAPIQLMRMKVEPFMIADALRAVVSQRLCRVLCPNCRQQYQPTIEEVMLCGFKRDHAETIVGYARQRPVFTHNDEGCNQCFRGYRGRTALHEVLIMDESCRDLLLGENPSSTSLRHEAMSRKDNRMKPLIVDGMEKVFQGITTFSEIRRVAS